MSISISNLIFDGPHKDISKLKGQSGIYIIFHREEGRNSILDVGESIRIEIVRKIICIN